MPRLPAAVAALMLVSALSACTTNGDSSSTTPTPTSSSSAPTTPTSPTTSIHSTPFPTDGEVTPTQDLLDWQPVPGPVDSTVTVGGGWTVSTDAGGKVARIDGPQPQTVKAGKNGQVTQVLLDGTRAVVVVQDTLAEHGDRATIVDLTSGGTATVDERTDPPTTTGGTWALGQEMVVHASVGPDGAYCLATVSLESGQGSVGWCAPADNGFRGAVITPAGLSVMSFDNARPVSCATLLSIEGDQATPFDGVTDCQGWDAALLDGGAIWSEVPKPHRQEQAEFHARVGDQPLDLGPGTTGSLVWCGSAAYFVRDPQTKTDPARLLRFTPDGTLAVVYESKSHGNAFLSAPRCGGDTITLTSLGEAGDEQVSATIS